MIRKLFGLLLLASALISTGIQAQGSLIVTPPSGPPGTVHTIQADGLTANGSYALQVVLRASGQTVFEAAYTADPNGVLTAQLISESSDTPGDYDLILSPVGGQPVRTGSFSISAAFQAEGTPLALGATVEGQFDGSRARDSYTFTAEAGQIVTITLLSSAFDAFVTLFGPDGQQLRYNDNGLPPTDAQITAYALSASGTYQIGVTSRESAESNGGTRPNGAYTLTLGVARPANEGTISAGETVVGELSLLAQRAQYSFSASAGDIVTIDLRSDAFDPAIALLSADGTALSRDDDGGGGLYARINRFTIPADGTYVIIVDGFRGFTGERTLQGPYTVALQVQTVGGTIAQATPVPPVAQATPVPPAASAGAMDYGQTTVGELGTGVQSGAYTFTGQQGDVVSISLDSFDFDPIVTLRAPDGSVLAEDDDSGGELNALLSGVILPRDGIYTIEVNAYRGPADSLDVFGSFTLALNRTSGAAVQAPTGTPPPAVAQPTQPPTSASGELQPGQVLDGELSESAQGARYTFSGRAGDTVTIDLTSVDIDPLVRLLGPDGAVLAEDDDSGGGVQARISAFVLPVDGLYTVEVDAFRGIDPSRLVLGRYSVALALTPAPVAVAPTPTPLPTLPPEQPGSTPAPTTVPQIVPSDATAIAYGDSLDLTVGQPVSLSFSGQAGDVLSVKVNSDGMIDTALTLISADGALIASDDDGGDGFDPEFYGLQLPQDGSYILTIAPVVPGAAGIVSLSLERVGAASLESGPLTVTLSDKFAPQSLNFTARAGEMIRVVVTSVSQIGGDPVIEAQQDGVALARNTVGINLRMSFEFIVPADGRVDIKINRDVGAYGVLEIAIER